MIRRDSGHAGLIIGIIVLVIAILGTLAFLFWQNFINHPAVSSQVTSFEECKKAPGSVIQESYPERCVTRDGQTFVGPSDTSVKFETYCTVAEKLCFEYESDWKIEKLSNSNAEPGASRDLLRVTSPDGLILMLDTGVSGLGGTCPDEAAGDVVVKAPIKIPSMGGYKSDEYNVDSLYVAKIVYKSTEGGYIAAIYASNSKQYTTPGTIQGCGAGFSEYVEGRHSVVSSDYDSAGAFRFGFVGSEYYGETAPRYDSVADAEAALTSNVYVQAANLLASLRYE